jgi:hypothetical protein
LKDETDFFRLEEIVDRNHDASSAKDGEQGDYELRAIPQPDGHSIARFDMELPLELVCQPIHLTVETAVGILVVPPIKRGFAPILTHSKRKCGCKVHVIMKVM